MKPLFKVAMAVATTSLLALSPLAQATSNAAMAIGEIRTCEQAIQNIIILSKLRGMEDGLKLGDALVGKAREDNTGGSAASRFENMHFSFTMMAISTESQKISDSISPAYEASALNAVSRLCHVRQPNLY